MIEELKKYVLENNLHEKAIKDFWFAFNNWKKEYPKEYSKRIKDIPEDEINLFIHCVGLRSAEWPNCDRNHVTVSSYICYKERNLGNYTVWYSLSDPLDDDDFLEI